MINELENKNKVSDALSEQEFEKDKEEMMRYRTNDLSYKLGLLALACSVFACFIGLNSINPKSYIVIIKILLNIAVLLIGFLACEKAKSYSKQGSITLIVLGGICAARILWIPRLIMTTYLDYKNAYDARQALIVSGTTSGDEYDALETKLSSIENGPYMGKTMVSKFKDIDAVAILNKSGVFRGVFAMLLLALAAALLITAGVFGIIRTNKLNKYLNSINAKKN